MKRKIIPQRQCLACREMKDKSVLIRIVRAPDGTFLIDDTGRANGRGAYVCRTAACIEKCVKSKQLNRSFKTNVDAGIYEALSGRCVRE